MPTNRNEHSIPLPALLLGVAGLIPFVGLSAASFLYDGLIHSEITFALICYGAVILSFLGGVHWGMAIVVPQHLNIRRLTVSVIPSLIAWIALLLVEQKAILLLLLSFIAMLFVDTLATKSQIFPAWYARLRWGLTTIVCLSLGASFVNLQ